VRDGVEYPSGLGIDLDLCVLHGIRVPRGMTGRKDCPGGGFPLAAILPPPPAGDGGGSSPAADTESAAWGGLVAVTPLDVVGYQCGGGCA
jgi:hypothetical protein